MTSPKNLPYVLQSDCLTDPFPFPTSLSSKEVWVNLVESSEVKAG